VLVRWHFGLVFVNATMLQDSALAPIILCIKAEANTPAASGIARCKKGIKSLSKQTPITSNV
jgi:hypothetical protein